MDVRYHLNGTDFVWNDRKAAGNPGKHDGVTFEQAATVFFDPLFRLVDAGRNDEARDAIIGFDAAGRLLFVVHVQFEDAFIRIIRLARPATKKGESMSISETVKARLVKDRPMTSITLRIPVDVVESMKSIAPKRGFTGYQTLLKAYLSEGLRRDEAQFAFSAQARLLDALRKHGVSQAVLDEATKELDAA